MLKHQGMLVFAKLDMCNPGNGNLSRSAQVHMKREANRILKTLFAPDEMLLFHFIFFNIK